MSQRHFYFGPRDPSADSICLLTREWAERRAVPFDALVHVSLSEETTQDGIVFRLAAAPDMWQTVRAFVAEEGECCPFLAFDATEDDGEIILRIFQPEAVS
jgi:hypothetical protein